MKTIKFTEDGSDDRRRLGYKKEELKELEEIKGKQLEGIEKIGIILTGGNIDLSKLPF